jgi:hypothetical protein
VLLVVVVVVVVTRAGRFSVFLVYSSECLLMLLLFCCFVVRVVRGFVRSNSCLLRYSLAVKSFALLLNVRMCAAVS